MSAGIQIAATSTHVPSQPWHVSNSYQRARINVFVCPAIRHQLDALSAEWRVPLVEVVRRVMSKGLEGIMQTVPAYAKARGI